MKPTPYQAYNPLQKPIEALPVLLLGGVGYYLLELLWRGYSHPVMAICGAICYYFVYQLCRTYPHVPMLWRALLGAVFITLIELFTGCLCNLGLGMAIWDYSNLPYQFLGQICLGYSLGWFLLCIPLCGVSRVIRRFLFLADV